MSSVVLLTAQPSLHAATDPEIDAARNTAVAVQPNAPEAMEEQPPDRGAPIEVDPRVDLGLSTRMTSSLVVPSEQYRPDWIGQTETGARTGDDISDAGYAASRERMGEFGHGTLPYAIGIQNVDFPEFGGRHFVVHERVIQPNETAQEWGIGPLGYSQQGLIGDSAYAVEGMIQARHAAETGQGFNLDGLWD